jgi:glycosyltransferase involved in cell wall biosynthesis
MITAIILSHNNEGQIKKTLDSVAWSDELIVMDDNSEDNTVSIAQKSRARVVKRSVAGDFAAQRNTALKEAKGEWVLYVDSDEIVSAALQKEIQRTISEDDAVGYMMRRQDYMYGKPFLHGETASVKLLRLAKKNAGAWVRPVHEVWEVKGKVKELSEPLLHYPHPSVAEFLEDINNYSTLNASYLYKKKVHVAAWHIVAYPVAKFLRNYIVHRGFLDGTRGTILAIMMSFHSFLTRAKLYQLWHAKAQ